MTNKLRSHSAWQYPCKTPTPEYLAAIEFVAKAPIPDAYREFLQTINSPFPKQRHYFKFNDPPEWMQLWDFSCANEGIGELMAFTRYVRPSPIPLSGFPIATTIWENFVFIGLEPPHKDKVFLWHQDHAEAFNQNPYLFPLANDFWEFFDNLVPLNNEILKALNVESEDDLPQY